MANLVGVALAIYHLALKRYDGRIAETERRE
jgi:hypothetical protein